MNCCNLSFVALLLIILTLLESSLVFDNDQDKSILMDLHRQFLSADEIHSMMNRRRQLRGGGHGMMMGDGQHDGMMDSGYHHEGMMGGHGQHDGMGLTQEEHEVVMALFQHSHVITREPHERGNNRGCNITTTSSDHNVAALIQQHVNAMTHLKNGRRVRQCDPLYKALFDHMESTQLQVDYLENQGVRVIHTGTTECARELIHDHTYTVSRFIDTGNMRPNFDWKLPKQCISEPKEEQEDVEEERVEDRL